MGHVSDVRPVYQTVGVTIAAGWRQRARCRESYGVFFEDDAASLRRARAFCAGCRVWSSCLAYALGQDDQGLWGGLRRSERNRLKRLVKRWGSTTVAGRVANRADVRHLLAVMPVERLALVLGVEQGEFADGLTEGRLAR